MTTETDTGEIERCSCKPRKAKNQYHYKKLGKGKEELSPTGFKGSMALPTSFRLTDFRRLTSRFVRQYISVVLSYSACGNLCGILTKLIHSMIKWDFSIHKTTNVIHHTNRIKDKNYIFISTDAEKAFDKNTTCFHGKTPNKLSTERIYLNTIKVISDKLTASNTQW